MSQGAVEKVKGKHLNGNKEGNVPSVPVFPSPYSPRIPLRLGHPPESPEVEDKNHH
jgi:hypothetical protein